MYTSSITQASTKQRNFINQLMGERELPEGFVLAEDLSSRQASDVIGQLINAPLKGALVPLGYYLLDDEVYKVVLNKAGTGRYANRQILIPDHACKWEYSAGAIYKLANATPITLAEAAQFGHEHGWCMVCGKKLTVTKSIERGIGPKCAQKVGA
jgi:hypothetical protein